MTERLTHHTCEFYDIPATISHRRLLAVDGSVVKEPGQSPDWCFQMP
ncbi:hypothetical protein AAE115_004512 [Salmonella enterica]|nr:hypothetical protein [Salmonella enterica]